MSDPIDHELIARWRDEPAPLLPILHAFHDRDGYLSDDALRAVSTALRIPLADLYGTVTFYHHFSAMAHNRRLRPAFARGRSVPCVAERHCWRPWPIRERHPWPAPAAAISRSLSFRGIER